VGSRVAEDFLNSSVCSSTERSVVVVTGVVMIMVVVMTCVVVIVVGILFFWECKQLGRQCNTIGVDYLAALD
jgi:phosphotransferase system  glucose/maltose/N-acetylglucosamine-specific IIC component